MNEQNASTPVKPHDAESSADDKPVTLDDEALEVASGGARPAQSAKGIIIIGG